MDSLSLYTSTAASAADADNGIAPLFSGINLLDNYYLDYDCFDYPSSSSVGGVVNGSGFGPYNPLSPMDLASGSSGSYVKTEPPSSLIDDYTSSSSPGSGTGSMLSPEQSSPAGSGSGGCGGGGSAMAAGGTSGGLGGVGSRKNKDDKICGVCGDRALGYNFDAISCESCKAFFRRNALKGMETFKCPYEDKCRMDISNRRFCKRCRLQRCFDIGMKKEYILTEDEKERKRQKIKENRMIREFERRGLVKPGSASGGSGGEVSSSQTRALSPEDSQRIQELVDAYDASLAVSVPIVSRDAAATVVDLANIAELSVRRVIDMMKKIKAFKALPQLDQIALLKGGSIELLIIRAVLTYDKDKNHFLDPTDLEDTAAMKLSQFQRAENGSGLFDENMKFVRSLAIDLQADRVTLILMLVIALFSPDRSNLTDKLAISQLQDRYSQLLRCYLESKMPPAVASAAYPKLLMKLTDIRDLSEKHSHVLLNLNPEGIVPLMQEVLDLRHKPAVEK